MYFVLREAVIRFNGNAARLTQLIAYCYAFLGKKIRLFVGNKTIVEGGTG
jgi:hypothetical protein